MALFIIIGMLISVIAAFVVSLITPAIGGYSFDFSFATGSFWWQQFLQFCRTFFVLIPYVLLGFLMAIVGRSAMPGIATGIGVVLLESIIPPFMTLAGGWIARIPDYLLSANMNAITALNDLPTGFGAGGPFGDSASALPGVTHAFVTLGIYSLVFLALGFYLFRKRDVTG